MLSPHERSLLEQFARATLATAQVGSFAGLLSALERLGTSASNAALYSGDEAAVAEIVPHLTALAAMGTISDPFGVHPTWWPCNFLRDDGAQFEELVSEKVRPFDRKLLRSFFKVLDQNIDRASPAREHLELHEELRGESGKRYTLLDPFNDARISDFPVGRGSRPGIELFLASERDGTWPNVRVGSQLIPYPAARAQGFDLDLGRVEAMELLGAKSGQKLAEQGIRPVTLRAGSLKEFETIHATYEEAIARAGANYSLWMRGQSRPFKIYDALGQTKAGWEVARSRIAKRLTHLETDDLLIPSSFRNFDSHWKTKEQVAALLASVGAWQLVADRVMSRYANLFPLDPCLDLPDDLAPAAVAALEDWERNPYESSLQVELSIFQTSDATPVARSSAVIDGQSYTLYERRHKLSERVASGGLLLQHYGCPTGGLDITDDAHVALAFAAGSIGVTDRGKFRRQALANSAAKPVVYFLLLREGRDPYLRSTDMFVGAPFPNRIEAQHCGILFGSSSYCRNYAYRHVIAAVEIDFMLPEDSMPERVYPRREDDAISSLICESFEQGYEIASARLYAGGRGIRAPASPQFLPTYRD